MATDCLFKITIQLQEAIAQNDGRLITHINIPCGKCARCIQRRKMEWGFRMGVEMARSKTAYFTTLTYSPEHVPINNNGKKTLIPTRSKDLTLWLHEKGRKRITKKFKKECKDRSIEGFFKRLRQHHKRAKPSPELILHNLLPSDPVRFYAAGEYGSERKRPHYHAIIFNTSIREIEKSWPFGGVMTVPANEATISYVMKYLDKRFDKAPEWGKEPEFNIMSEGIGEEYIEKFGKWHRRNIDVLYVTTKKGIRIPMCKYYRHKIFNEKIRKEQVELVSEKIENVKKEEIEKVGQHAYNKKQVKLKYESQRRFKKNMKKRFVD